MYTSVHLDVAQESGTHAQNSVPVQILWFGYNCYLAHFIVEPINLGAVAFSFAVSYLALIYRKA